MSIEFIQNNQELIASELLKSFYFSKGNIKKQREYFLKLKNDGRLDLSDFNVSDLMSNPAIEEALVNGYKSKHPDKQEGGTIPPQAYIYQQLYSAIEVFKKDQIVG